PKTTIRCKATCRNGSHKLHRMVMNMAFICSILRRPPIFTLFPYTTLFRSRRGDPHDPHRRPAPRLETETARRRARGLGRGRGLRDRKSTRLNSSHVSISYAVFCLKKKI